MTAAQAPETAWQNQQATLQSQANALTQLQTDTTNIDNDVQALNSITGPLSARTVTSSELQHRLGIGRIRKPQSEITP